MKPILADLAVAHACILTLAFVTPSCLSPSIDLFYGLRMIQSALMGQYVLLHPKAIIQSCKLFYAAPRSVESSFVVHGRNYRKHWNASSITRLYTCDSVILRIFNRNSMLVQRLLLFWIENILDTENSCRFNRTNSFWPKSPYVFGVDLTTSGCGLFSLSIPRNQTFGLWNKP